MDARSQAQIDAWLRAACADAERRSLPQLKPLLEALARSTAALREADRAVHEVSLVPGTIDPDDPRRASRSKAETTE
jgi:hypothetical protein